MCFAQFQVWKSSKSNVRLTRSAKVEGGTKNGFGSLGNWRSLIPWPWPQSSPLHSILLRNSLSFAVILVFNKPTSSFNFYIHTFTRAQVQEFRTWILLLIIWFVFFFRTNFLIQTISLPYWSLAMLYFLLCGALI